MSGPLLHLENVSKIYPSGTAHIHALKDVSVSIESGRFIALMGKSGSGKSSLLQLMGGLDWPSSGQILWKGQKLSNLSEADLAKWRGVHTGFVFQTFNLVPNLNLIENVELPLLLAGIAPKERKSRASELVERVGLTHRIDQKPPTLSGGEKQRVAMARALAADPELILADEPTGNLDESSGADVLDLLEAFHQNGKAVVLATHDAQAAQRAEEVYELRDGILVSKSESGA